MCPPYGIPPCGGDRDTGGASRRFYCPVRSSSLLWQCRSDAAALYCGILPTKALLRSRRRLRKHSRRILPAEGGPSQSEATH